MKKNKNSGKLVTLGLAAVAVLCLSGQRGYAGPKNQFEEVDKMIKKVDKMNQHQSWTSPKTLDSGPGSNLSRPASPAPTPLPTPVPLPAPKPLPIVKPLPTPLGYPGTQRTWSSDRK